MTKYIEKVNVYLSQMKIKQTYISDYTQEKIAFYAGNPTERQNEIAGKLENLMENIDEVMSAKHRFMNISKE